MTEALRISITLDPRDSQALYMQLYTAIRQMIESGRLKPGERLPASRAFAADLGISRVTVVSAFEQLTAEGYVAGRRGSGMRVCDSVDGVVRPRPRRLGQPALPAVRPAPRAPGLPDPRLFPMAAWKNAVVQVARSSISNWTEEDDSLGSPRLRRAIAAYLAERRDLIADASDIMITNGATGAIGRLLMTLTKPGDLVALENPTHPGIRSLVEHHGLSVAAIPVDNEGARIEVLAAMEPAPRLVILTPSNHYPLGGALSAGRRHAALSWAEQTGGLIIEDDYDSEFRYVGKPFPALAGGTYSDRIVYVGSFSKVLSQGLSLGYMILPKSLKDFVRDSCNESDGRPSVPTQGPLAVLMENGDFGRHLRRMRRAYGERRSALLKVLNEIGTEDLIPIDRAAGMHVVVRFGRRLAHVDDSQVARIAVDAGIKARPLSRYCFSPPVEKGLLIGFSGSSIEEIRAFGAKFTESLASLVPRGDQ